MRRIAYIALILTLSIQGQTIKQKLGQYAKAGPFMVASGVLGGIEEGSLQEFNSENFFKRFPNANRQFWDARISHENKWLLDINGDFVLENGERVERFWLSSSALAWTTDGYHMVRTGKRLLLYTGFTYSAYLNKKADWDQKWYVYVIDAAVYSIIWSSSFHLTYNTMTR